METMARVAARSVLPALAVPLVQVACGEFQYPVVVFQRVRKRRAAGQHRLGSQCFQRVVQGDGAHRSIGFKSRRYRESGADDDGSTYVLQVLRGAQVITGLQCSSRHLHVAWIARNQQFFDGGAEL